MMKHTEAEKLLVEFVDGTLGESQRAGVDAHARSCHACHGWIKTYDRVAGGVSAAADHPTPDTIATYANEPADLSESRRSELEVHLRRCSSCIREYQLTHRALEEARSADVLATLVTRHAWPQSNSNRKWIAAGALAAAATLAIAVAVAFRAGETPRVVESADYRVHGERLTGHKVIEAPDRLIATDVHVETDSSLTLRADKTVLGEHFSVGRGGRLVITTTGVSNDAPANTGKARGGKT